MDIFERKIEAFRETIHKNNNTNKQANMSYFIFNGIIPFVYLIGP